MIKNLFSSKVLFEVLAFLFRNEAEFISTSEIIEATGKNQANILRELEKLINNKLVTKIKKGNQNFYQVDKKNPYYRSLKMMFGKYNSESGQYILVTEEPGPAFLSLHYFMKGYGSNLALKKGIINQSPDMITFFRNDYVWFYFEKDKFKKCAEESLMKLLENPKFVEEIIYKETDEKGKDALNIFNELKGDRFKVTREKALSLLEQFIDIITTQVSLNFIGVLDLVDYPYTNYLKYYLEDKAKGTKFKPAWLLEKLLTPEHLTSTQKMRQELLDLAIKTKKGRGNFKDELSRIKQNWEWINYGYRGPALEYDYFEKMYKEIAENSPEHLQNELDQLLNLKKRILEEKRKIYKDLKIDEKHQNFIKALSLLSYMKIYRKDTAFLVIYLTYKILDQFNKNIKKINLYYLTLEEAAELIKGTLKIKRQELIKREKSCLQFAKSEKLIVGPEAEKIVKKLVSKTDIQEKEIDLLDGTTASLGETGDWVYGTVKIINRPEEMKKMNEGDILVAVATTPDLLSAMKKAAAIVTDHGGITCHAAIVSRELNIPCIIGTKYATKIFKDGDKVIVCPRHSYIKFQ